MNKEEKIIELRIDRDKLKELVEMMKGDFTSGTSSTLNFLHINFEYKDGFFPRTLSYSFSEKLTAQIALPIIQEKLKKIEKELFKLEHPILLRLFGL